MSNQDFIYQSAAWVQFNAYQRKAIGIPGYIKDVSVGEAVLPIYASPVTDSGFVIIQNAMVSGSNNPRNRLIRNYTEASLGRLSMNYGFSKLIGTINQLVLRFRMAESDTEQTEIAHLITELCLLPVLEEGHPITPPATTLASLPDRKNMKQTANAITQSPMFPVEFYISEDAKRSMMKKVYGQVDGCRMFGGDLEKFMTRSMMKKGVEILAFSVFTTALRYAELMDKYANVFIAESSIDAGGSTVQYSPFGAGLRRGMGTNLGRGGIDSAALMEIAEMETYQIFFAGNAVLIAQLGNAIPSYIRMTDLIEQQIETDFNQCVAEENDQGKRVRAFLESRKMEGVCLDATAADNTLPHKVFVGEFLAFSKEMKNTV